MIRRFPPIFFSDSSPPDKKEKNEYEKVSYWLEKLHKQERNRVDKEKEKEQLNGSKGGMQFIPSISGSPPQFQESGKTLEEKGIDEHTKNQATKNEADRQLTNRLVKSSNRCIISISSIFPCDFFPNTINIEENRVTFIFRQFLATQSHSVDIKDISNVFIESSFFFATLQIVSRTYVQNDIKIGNLDKKKAIRARMMIEGLRTLIGNSIDTSIYTVDELLSKVEEMHASQGGQIR